MEGVHLGPAVEEQPQVVETGSRDRVVGLHEQEELPFVGDQEVAELPEELVGAAAPAQYVPVERVDGRSGGFVQ